MKESSYVIKKEKINNLLWKKKAPMLSKLDMELTERCNNNCIHCSINLSVHDIVARENELSKNEIKMLLKDAVDLGCITVRFTGGEPLLRNDFEEIYIYARSIGLRVRIFTNATLITDKTTELLSNIPPLENIEVSLYGLKRYSYECSTRTPGSFSAAWKGINLLLDRNIPFVVKGAILPLNREELKQFEAWGSTIPWMKKRNISFSMFYDLRCRRDSEEKNEIIKRLRISPEDAIEIITRRRKEFVREIKQFWEKYSPPLSDYLFTCGSGIGQGCVDSYGYLQPCLLMRHPDLVYNIKNHSLKDILTRFFPKMRQMKANNYKYLTRCAKCFIRNLCKSCPAKSWIEEGVLDSPVEYYCKIAHAQARFLGVLEKGEAAWEVVNWSERIKVFQEKVF